MAGSVGDVSNRPTGWAFHAAICGIHDPISHIWQRGLDSAVQREPVQVCVWCGCDVMAVDSGFGTNWVGGAGNGLCARSPNGVHWP